jgi:hypothetical protein
VSFVALWQSEEYKDIANLERVKLCDTVTVYFEPLDITAQAKVIRTDYDVLKERYSSIELGDARSNFTSEVRADIASNSAEIIKRTVSPSYLKKAIDRATELIRGGLGGYVVFTTNSDGEPQEITIMDTDDVQTATQCIRINKNGIGFSLTGYDGPYTSAWTIDGHFNADFITAGTMSANYIRGGTLKLGGANNGNGLLQVYNANNQKIGEWDKDGADMTGEFTNTGTFNVYDTYSMNPQKVGETELGVKIKGSVICFLRDGNAVAKMGCYQENAAGNITVYQDEDPGMYIRYGKSFSLYTVSNGAITSTISARSQQVSVQGVLNTSLDINCGTDITCSDLSASGYVSAGYGVNTNFIRFDGSSGRYSHCIYGYQYSDGSTKIYINSDYIELDPSQGSRCTIWNQEIATVSSSSLRYKHNIKPIEDADLNPHKLLDLPVVQFEWNADHSLQYKDMEGKTIPGIIAEDVEKIYPSATIHKDGQVESWDERRLIPGMLALIQEQDKKIKSLEARLAKLEELLK